MLKYKVKLNESKGYNEIKYDELYLSPDLSFISGVTDYSYELMDGQKLALEFNNDERFHEVEVKIENVIRKGYVVLSQPFDIEDYEGVKGFFYIDNKYYFTSGNTINVLGKNVTIVDNKVYVDTVYWIEDNKLVIGENTYEVNIQLDKEGNEINPHYVTIKGGKVLPINNCTRDKWKKVTKFYIRKDNDYTLKLDDVSCAKKYPYFFYNVEKTTAANDETKIHDYINTKHYLTYNYTNKRYEAIIGNKTFVQDYSKVKCGDEIYDLQYEWRNTVSSNRIHLLLNMPQYNFTNGQKIIAETSVAVSTKCDIRFSGTTKNNDGYIIYCGKRYNESTDTIDFIVIDGVEYELTYTQTNWGISEDVVKADAYAYITIEEGKPIPIAVRGEKCLKLVQTSTYNVPTETLYDIVKYHYVTIDGDKYLVKTYNKVDVENTKETVIEYVDVIRKEKITLYITDVVNNSMIRCAVDIDKDGESDGVCDFIASNYKIFNFKLLNPVFEEHNILRDSFILASIRGEEEVFDTIKIFNPSHYIKIPFSIGNDMATNVLQQDTLENIFFVEEIEKSINPYVDMEREIYYPYCDGKKEFKEVSEIRFDLHFRSRNLDDWKINEDVFKDMGETSKKALKTKYTWNLFDNYENYSNGNTAFTNDEGESLKPTISDDVDLTYYQPADLLYFLNFDTDDVFYQKSKIAKSFLRLLFFDSNDVANQTLLYSCTVWMNENKLYKTYIDNVVKTDNKYVSVSEDLNDIEVITSSTIGVYNDTCNDNNEVTFEDDKRLAATFTVNNRYETEESAEGFYLYIFKDYCEKRHEKTIYMKVEFNHAGEGRTINFLMPFKYDEDNDEPTLMDLSPDGEDFEEFIKGCPLKELYEHLFIPINVVYDEEKKRYAYYLPKGLVKHDDESVMRFNLYELKIADES